MNKTITNTELFEETAKKLNLTFKRIPTAKNKSLFTITGNGRFYVGSAATPGFYPTVSRWHALFTMDKRLTQTTLKQLGYKTISSLFF